MASRALLVLGQSPVPIEMVDRQGRVLYCNPAYTATFSTAASEVLDRPSRTLPPRLDGRSLGELLDHVLQAGSWVGEAAVGRAPATLFSRIRIFPVLDAGAPEEFAVFYEDVRAEPRHRAPAEVLNMIAHQWRQPLAVVASLVGNIQLKAQRGEVDAVYLSAKLERVADTVQFLSETIDSFRTFDAPSKHKSVEDLVSLARKSVDLVMPALEASAVAVEWKTEERLPVRVFRGEFQQLLLELVNNAREALAGPGARLRIELDRQGDRAVLRVGNNGPAIPAALAARIFEPYFTTKDSGNGSGLGLHLAKTIVEGHHGGELTVSSSDWTWFTCAFPLGEEL